MYSCDGLNVTTIEGIGSLKNDYHPVQKALYHFNGTQCGYCSPGMVMNMYSLLEANNNKVTMQQVENSFGGNICRCTGYRPILDAFKSLASNSCTIDDIEDLTLDVCQINDARKCNSKKFNKKCEKNEFNFHLMPEINVEEEPIWLKPASLLELLKIFTTKTLKSEYMLVGGNTAHGSCSFFILS